MFTEHKLISDPLMSCDHTKDREVLCDCALTASLHQLEQNLYRDHGIILHQAGQLARREAQLSDLQVIVIDIVSSSHVT